MGHQLPIYNFVAHIEDAIKFAKVEETPYTDQQVSNIAYQVIYETGLMNK